MHGTLRNAAACVLVITACMVLLTAAPARADLNLGAEQIVQASGSDIVVPGYSVPTFACWDGDDRKDLIVGEGDGLGHTPKVRVYLNTGTAESPQFGTYFYAQANGADLIGVGSGCMGVCPRVVDWDGDGRKDLLVGYGDGRIFIYLNIGTDASPTFDGGTALQVGQPGAKTVINVGGRATPCIVDVNNDGKKDLVLGALDGQIRVFINEGTDTQPDFRTTQYLQLGGSNLVVPTNRACPVLLDADGDGDLDLLTGNTEGQLLYYQNTGGGWPPVFSSYSLLRANGVVIDLAGTPRSRPFVCDFNNDGLTDALVGAGDGKVHLYLGHWVGNVDGDNHVDVIDLLYLIDAFGTVSGDAKYDPRCDFNADNAVDVIDLLMMIDDFGK